MKYYLSSYKLGNELTKLRELIQQTSGKFGFIPNALDSAHSDPIKKKERIEDDMANLRNQGAEVELLDLKKYFGKKDELKEKLSTLGGICVSGGNSFILRQAMKLSGLDELILENAQRNDFLYMGYSAGVCVLTPSLKPYAIVDDSTDFPYSQITQQMWDGLGILQFAFEPHYKSDHPESQSIEKEVHYCIENKILFKAYKDGEVLIIE